MVTIASTVGKGVALVSSRLGLGAGATWPGEIALRLDPDILTSFLTRVTHGIIVVAGTNGKTTTARMITHVLTAKGNRVLQNKSGANLLNGIVSTFLKEPSGTYDYAVFEVDENALVPVLSHLESVATVPITIVLLNLFRDQLDRYGEVDAIAAKWEHSLSRFTRKTTIIYNADDPQLVYLTRNLNTQAMPIGLSDPTLYLPAMQHATDSIYCPSCGKKLVFKGVYFSHLGDWTCTQCGLKKPRLSLTGKTIRSPLEGVYNRYNTLFAFAVVNGMGMHMSEFNRLMAGFTPAFGRMEEVTYANRMWKILLSKNPTGFNESLRTALASQKTGPMILVLNDRIPDGTDVSWIWDVDFEVLNQAKRPIILSGDRALDLAVRLKYALDDFPQRKHNGSMLVKQSLADAIEGASHWNDNGERIWILATYSAMLDVRKILTGKKIL